MEIDSYIAQGWRLSEFSQWVTYQEKDNFLHVLGPDNIVIVDEKDFRKRWKATVLISPTGLEILNLYFMPIAGTA